MLPNGCCSGSYQIIKLISGLGMPGRLECEADLNGCRSSRRSVTKELQTGFLYSTKRIRGSGYHQFIVHETL